MRTRRGGSGYYAKAAKLLLPNIFCRVLNLGVQIRESGQQYFSTNVEAFGKLQGAEGRQERRLLAPRSLEMSRTELPQCKIRESLNWSFANGGFRYMSTTVHDCLYFSSFCNEHSLCHTLQTVALSAHLRAPIWTFLKDLEGH